MPHVKAGKMKEIKGAIFDIDGTLLDSLHVWRIATERFLEGVGCKADAEMGRALKVMSLEEGCVFLRDHFGLSMTPEEIRMGLLTTIRDYYRNEVELKPGANEFVRAFATLGLPMVLATTGDGEAVKGALERHGLWEYFDRLFTSLELGTSKRDPATFIKCAEYMGISPEEAVVFEDSFFAVDAAKEAGCPVVVLWDKSNDAITDELREKADLYMKEFDFEEFRKFMEERAE